MDGSLTSVREKGLILVLLAIQDENERVKEKGKDGKEGREGGEVVSLFLFTVHKGQCVRMWVVFFSFPC